LAVLVKVEDTKRLVLTPQQILVLAAVVAVLVLVP
jgi:preprotein translocase subunit Sec61beta